MYTLVIIILASTLQNPKPHPSLTVSLLYDTQFTCEQAESGLNIGFITKAYRTTHKGSSVKRVTTACERNPSNRI